MAWGRVAGTGEPLTEGAPPIRIVLSLREDHLGLLEEAADHLPQILDHRFRLRPLTVEAAAAAMTRPAEIDDPALATRPFRFEPAAVTAVLAYLSRRRRGSSAQADRHVEPFQLQLVCQRVERIVAARQERGREAITVRASDIGGDAALRETLKEFYTSAVRSLPDWRVRRAARRLCEEFLISPEGRRLSLEENEIERQLALAPATLELLVARRLLRSDHRSDSSYYELSHDALIDPVLATRRRSALLFAWLGLVMTSLAVAFIALVAVVTLLTSVVTPEETGAVDTAATLIGSALFVPLVIVLVLLSRRNLRSLRRYRHRTAGELEGALPTGRTRANAAFGVAGIVVGSTLVVLALVAVVSLVIAVSPGKPSLMANDPYFMAVHESWSRHGVGFDAIALLLSVPVAASFGIRVMRWGTRKLLGAPTIAGAPETDPARPRNSIGAMAADGLIVTFSTIALLACAVLAATSVLPHGCAHDLPPPDWVFTSTNFVSADCEKARTRGIPVWEAMLGWLYVLAAGSEAARPLVRRAARRRVPRGPANSHRRAVPAGSAGGVSDRG